MAHKHCIMLNLWDLSFFCDLINGLFSKEFCFSTIIFCSIKLYISKSLRLLLIVLLRSMILLTFDLSISLIGMLKSFTIGTDRSIHTVLSVVALCVLYMVGYIYAHEDAIFLLCCFFY